MFNIIEHMHICILDIIPYSIFCSQLIKPDELINPKVDELSMMTYLSQYPNAKLKPGAPLRPKTNPSRVRAYGPGMLTIMKKVCCIFMNGVETRDLILPTLKSHIDECVICCLKGGGVDIRYSPIKPFLAPICFQYCFLGIESTGNCVGAPARFIVETFSAGRGEVSVIVLNPKGQQEPVSTPHPHVYL